MTEKGRARPIDYQRSLAQQAGVADKPITAPQVRKVLREELEQIRS